MDIKQLTEAVALLTKRVDSLETQLAAIKPRDRGPKSSKEMTEQDAFDVKFGKHKELKPKLAAIATGLSYGQIFSCRGGYTFKQVTKDWKPKVAQPEAQKQ